MESLKEKLELVETKIESNELSNSGSLVSDSLNILYWSKSALRTTALH